MRTITQEQLEQLGHFKRMFERDNMAKTTLSAIVFGWKNNRQNYPNQYLTDKEEDICLNLIQWLGSPVGQGFLDSCGFVPKNNH